MEASRERTSGLKKGGSHGAWRPSGGVCGENSGRSDSHHLRLFSTANLPPELSNKKIFNRASVSHALII